MLIVTDPVKSVGTLEYGVKNLMARLPFTKLQTRFIFCMPYIPAVLLIGAPHKKGGHISGSAVEYVMV